jgi:ribokinase
MKRFDVIGFGALNVDKLYMVNRIAAREEESFITDYAETCGGSAANTIVGLARLGCKVGFIGKVANDREGKMLLEDFRQEEVNTEGIALAKRGRSGSVIGFIDRKGDRALYVDPGVNSQVESDRKISNYAFQCRFLHFTSFVGEKSLQAQKEILKVLPANVLISFDPGAIYARKGLAALEPIIERSYVLMPNAGELELLTGISDYEKGAKIMLEKGVKVVAVKLGERGCFVTDGKQSYNAKALKMHVISTTGAGDAFCAGFLYGLIKGKTLEQCARLGNFVASRSTTKVGAREGLPSLVDLRKSKLA